MDSKGRRLWWGVQGGKAPWWVSGQRPDLACFTRLTWAHPVEASAEPDGGAIDPVLETRGGEQYDQGEAGERDCDRGRIRQDAGQRHEASAAKGEQDREMQQVDAERQPAKLAAQSSGEQPLRGRP